MGCYTRAKNSSSSAASILTAKGVHGFNLIHHLLLCSTFSSFHVSIQTEVRLVKELLTVTGRTSTHTGIAEEASCRFDRHSANSSINSTRIPFLLFKPMPPFLCSWAGPAVRHRTVNVLCSLAPDLSYKICWNSWSLCCLITIYCETEGKVNLLVLHSLNRLGRHIFSNAFCRTFQTLPYCWEPCKTKSQLIGTKSRGKFSIA